jgi:ribose transport system substrate-binding protein
MRASDGEGLPIRPLSADNGGVRSRQQGCCMAMDRLRAILVVGLVAFATDAIAKDAFPGLEGLYKGSYQLPPKTAPKPAAGKKVWVVTCSQDVSVCAGEAQGIADAGKLLGWETTIFDGKYDPATWGNGVRQAIAGKYDAIAITGADCAGIKAPLEEARAAGLKIVAIEGADCDASTPGEKPLFDATVSYVEGDVLSWVKGYGIMQADYLIAKAKGAANVIVFQSDEVLVSKVQSEATVAEVKRCADCTVNVVKFSYTSPAPELQQLAEQALLRFPKTNGIAVPADSVILGGIGAAIDASGRDVTVMGGEGQEAAMALVRSGSRQMTAGVGIPSRWEGYAAVDALIRLFAGEKPVGSGAGLQVFDRDNNAGKAGAYEPDIDYVGAYRKAWGVAP